MQEQSKSLGNIVWKRFKKNRFAMFGLAVVVFTFFLAVFSYLFIPDKSKFANQMCLQASMLSPGSTINYLTVKPVGSNEKNGLADFFGGHEETVQLIPVSKFQLQKDSVLYIELGNEDAQWQSIAIRNLVSCDQNGIEKYVTKKTYLLGTDKFGRDVFSRLILASRVSISVGFIAVFISLIIGITLGALAGYYRGAVDTIITWLVNVVWSIPTLLLVVAITLALGKGFVQVFIAVGLTMWVEVTRLVRGQFFSLREAQFVEAGRSFGFKNSRIIFKHILPNVMGPVIVIAASNFASAILLEAGLSFLGLGAQPPMPSWGMMIKENYGYIVVDAAYLAIAPGIAIAILVMAFTFLGNGLRDAFDVKQSIN
jgi:peptide/nickel transport system permease protein